MAGGSIFILRTRSACAPAPAQSEKGRDGEGCRAAVAGDNNLQVMKWLAGHFSKSVRSGAPTVISYRGSRQPALYLPVKISHAREVAHPATYSYDADGVRMEKSSGTMYWPGPG